MVREQEEEGQRREQRREQQLLGQDRDFQVNE
jgi:hypothetical protein